MITYEKDKEEQKRSIEYKKNQKEPLWDLVLTTLVGIKRRCNIKSNWKHKRWGEIRRQSV